MWPIDKGSNDITKTKNSDETAAQTSKRVNNDSLAPISRPQQRAIAHSIDSEHEYTNGYDSDSVLRLFFGVNNIEGEQDLTWILYHRSHLVWQRNQAVQLIMDYHHVMFQIKDAVLKNKCNRTPIRAEVEEAAHQWNGLTSILLG